MNDSFASHGSSWNGILSLIFVFYLIQSWFSLTQFFTHHLREQTVISHFPFLRGNKAKYNVYAKIRRDPIYR